ncbi:MAG: serine/threonine protein kinase [Lachnospira eligens]
MYNEFYDRYEIIRELSCSRHSKVYLVRHRILDVYRVAKIFSGNQYDADRLLKEAHLIKNLKHPHIPVIYDIEQNIGEDNSSICIIEEYIDGKSLRQYVNDETGAGGNLSVHEICRIGVELCCILEYLHGFNGNGILHMDIKPDNIMLDINGKVKLIDFDNAVAGNAGVSVDSGSPLYAAPEQYSGEYAVTQSDVYSVGMVILFMVSHGHVKTDKGHNLAGIPRRYSRLYHVIEKSIHHQWGLRYSSVTLLKNELQGIMRRSGGTIEKHSYIVQVAGDKAGIGTTHTVMCMAHFFKKNGISCVVVDRSGNRRVLPPFLKNGLMEDGSYIYKGIRIIPDYNGAISVSVQKTDIILVDSGHSMRELENDKDIMDIAVENYAYIEVCVTGKHTVMCMAHFFKKNGISCVVVDRSGNRRVLPPFLKNGLMEDGSYIYKGIRIIPDYNGAISVSVQKTDIILVDSGHSMRELENDKDIMDIAVENYAYIEVCVTGKHICEENKRLRKLKEDRVYMLNLVSATQFYELTDMLKGKKCYREPCIYDWCEDNPIFDETMNDFLQDNLSELWEDCRPDRLKECIGRLYEKISSIRYFKGVKKKKSR